MKLNKKWVLKSKPSNTNNTDEQLMSSLQKGDESAFNLLYDRYSNRILYFMYKLLRNDEAKAQDFTQDVFIKVIESADQFDVKRSFKTWIFTIAANHCKNYFRSQKTWLDIEESGNGLATDSEIEKKLDNHSFSIHLQTAIDELKITFKETFILRYHEELKLKEIAEIMDCPVGTVKSRLNQATKTLAKKLKVYKVLTNDFKINQKK